MDIGKSNDSEVIVDAIISLGKSLNLDVTAEGIETQEQYLFLRERGCHEGQGFLFGKPMPVVQFEQILQKHAEKISQEKVVKIC